MSPAPAPPDAAPGGGTLDGGVPGGGRAAVTVTVMWEVVAAAGQFDDLLAWVLDAAPPGAAVYRSTDNRVVVIDPAGADPGSPPPHLTARPPHSYPFHPVPRRPPCCADQGGTVGFGDQQPTLSP